MDSLSNEDNKSFDNDSNEDYDFDNDENEDQIEDPQENQDFDERLLNERVEEIINVAEPIKSDLFGNEEADSGLSDNHSISSQESSIEIPSTTGSHISNVGRGRGRGQGHKKKLDTDIDEPLQIIQSSVSIVENDQSKTNILEMNPDTIPSTTASSIFRIGRGRYDKKALGENNEELPPPRIFEVEPVYKPKPLPIARLPRAYERKRMDPEIQKQCNALLRSEFLIDFTATFNQISFIIDKDDSKKKGYYHACRRLQEIQPNLQLDQNKLHSNIWNFGLHIYSISLNNPISCDLFKLMPEKIDNEDKRPFWFMFKNPPKFEQLKFIINPSKNLKGVIVSLDNGIRADLSSGALISMSRFCVHKDYMYMKQNSWSLYFRDEYFEIQTIKFKPNFQDSTKNLTIIKYRIPLDIIDRSAIIYLCNNGFCLFVNIKGNIHELHRTLVKCESNERNKDIPFDPFIRQGSDHDKHQPSFSTICIRMRVKTNEEIIESHLRRYQNSLSINPKPSPEEITKIREESVQQISSAFKCFIDFFHKNRVHLCFGSIIQRVSPIEQLAALNGHDFGSFIRTYSWTMLMNHSFRLQNLINYSKNFIRILHEYSKKKDDEESDDIDNRFYRLCLYLYRRSMEYFFLDLDTEITIGTDLYEKQNERSKRKEFRMAHFQDVSSSVAYIPSVVITPTTVKIRPLKLCKLNRVLRENQFGGVLNFSLVELRDEARRSLFPSVFRAIKSQIAKYLTEGFSITSSRIYKYLHHSQSQVKCKQFWFYYHDKTNGYLSHDDAYIWMGNFDKERVVAKHAARIALCFTSTDPTIRIPANMVTYVRDVKNATGDYTFTDGVGTISSQLRDKIQYFLGRHYQFSVLQIRYGGCKGTLSVDTRLDNKEYQMVIRDSMNKFTSDHDILEVCKLSAPRALYLNRQDIVLMESRDVPHTNFLHLQNEQHFSLIQALLTSAKAFELLNEKILPVFELRKIAQRLNIVNEQFFIRLITTCAFNIIKELIERTRIRIDNTKARNMFGIVDEYGVLESGQVFIQYTLMRENRLNLPFQEELRKEGQCKVHLGKVVITKNPCHHPGDLRVFDAVFQPELEHLKDVVVFPQKGDRPHSNEISGSDLDGDEYVVIWLDDLIPQTPNEDPYDYDSQAEPEKMNRSITRNDINDVVMKVSEQDCLGTLSNLHLAYADKSGIKSDVCIDLAGAISQEVDAAKTGQHPLTENQIIELRKGLDNKWPDFMKARGKQELYRSKRVLGKLYRSARRALTGWNQAIINHGNLHHIQLISSLTDRNNIQDQSNEQFSSILDPDITHPDYKKYLPEIEKLYKIYQEELLEIISLYRFEDEIDLFARSESMDVSAGGEKKGSVEDSAAIETKRLIERIRNSFYYEFNKRKRTENCCKMIEKKTFRGVLAWKTINCDICAENKLAKAACAYIHCYEECNRLPSKSNRRILSFPWLFASHLLTLRKNNNHQDSTYQIDTIVGPACALYLKNFTAKFQVLTSNYSSETNPSVEVYYEKLTDPRTIEKLSCNSFLRVCFIEILNDWLIKQKIFGNECKETDSKPLIPESIWHELIIYFLSGQYQSNVHLLSFSQDQIDINNKYNQIMKDYSLQWTDNEYQQLFDMFEAIHLLATQHAKKTTSTIWIYLDEYILLALQCIAIEKQLIDKWICS